MGIKFWDARKNDREFFVRFDRPLPDYPSVSVWICDEFGNMNFSGAIIQNGRRNFGIDDAVATQAGIEVDGQGRITPDSLAQICAEMAKRIQGDG